MEDWKIIKAIRNYLKTTDFQCVKNCFECCTSINFSSCEKERMNKVLRKNGYDQPPNGKGKEYCEYLTAEGRCSVYEERPIVCQAFGKIKNPFLTCSYKREYAVLPQTKNMIKYLMTIGQENGNQKGSDFMEKIKEGDFDCLAACCIQIVQCVEMGLLSMEAACKEMDDFEKIAQMHGYSLVARMEEKAGRKLFVLED